MGLGIESRAIIYPIICVVLIGFAIFIFTRDLNFVSRSVFIGILCLCGCSVTGLTDLFVNIDCDSSKKTSSTNVLIYVSTFLFVAIVITFIIFTAMSITKGKMINTLKSKVILPLFMVFFIMAVLMGLIANWQSDVSGEACTTYSMKIWLMISNFTVVLLCLFMFIVGILRFVDVDFSGRTRSLQDLGNYGFLQDGPATAIRTR